MYEGSPFGANDIAGDMNTTATLQHGDIVKSNIAPIDLDDDEDWFKVELKAGETYTFKLEATSGSALDGYLGLFKPNGNLVAAISEGHPDDPRGWIGPGDGSGDVELTYTPTKSGTYYLAATTAITSTNLAGHSDGAYRVSMLQAGKGTNGDDILIGTDEKDVLDGLAGNDLIKGKAGRDQLEGGSGRDKVYGGSGKDVLSGDGGNDRLFGDGDDDILWGGSGNDSVFGGSGQDTLFYTKGDDLLDGGKGLDSLYLGEDLGGGRIRLDLNKTGWQSTPNGKVKLVSIEYLAVNSQSEANYTLKGTGSEDYFTGGAGKDKLIGRGGNDNLSGRAGDDTILGGAGRDTIDGGKGNDRLSGGADRDYFKFELRKFGHDTITDFEVGGIKEKLNFSALRANKSKFDITLAANAKGTTHIEYKPTGATIDLKKAYFDSIADFWDQVIL